MRPVCALVLFALLTGVFCNCGEGSPTLSALSISEGALSPDFSPTTLLYMDRVSSLADRVQVTATVADPQASLEINGQSVSSGIASAPITLEAGPTMITVVVKAVGGATQSYGILVTRVPSDYLKASNTQANDRFSEVSLWGDTLAVGSLWESSNATGVNGNQADNSSPRSGAVYVFQRTGTTWAQQAYLKASNTDGQDSFGISLSLWGDTLAVGADGESSSATGVNGNQADNSAYQSGAVYVFQRTGATWAQQAYLKASNTDGQDSFGRSVSLSGDTLAIGAYGESSNATGVNGDQVDDSANQSGAVYVFQRSGTTWAQQAYLKASNTGRGDSFGFNVSLSNDTLAVGAPGEASSAAGINGDQFDDSALSCGAAYIFQRTGATWTQQAYIKASNAEAADLFGSYLSLSGDTLAVGAYGESSNATGINGNQADNSAMNSGAVYVFQRTGASWAQQAYLKASNTEAGDSFGKGVSLSGDVLAAGARYEQSNATGVNGNQADNSALGSGAVYVFKRTGTSWAQRAYIKASNAEYGDEFGASMSLSGNSLAVGASGEASNATGVNGNQADNSSGLSGAVYMFN